MRRCVNKWQQATTVLHIAAERTSVGIIWKKTPGAKAIDLFVLQIDCAGDMESTVAMNRKNILFWTSFLSQVEKCCHWLKLQWCYSDIFHTSRKGARSVAVRWGQWQDKEASCILGMVFSDSVFPLKTLQTSSHSSTLHLTTPMLG